MNSRPLHPISNYRAESFPYEFAPTREENTNAFRYKSSGGQGPLAPGETFTNPITLIRETPPTPIEPPRRTLRYTVGFEPNIARPNP